MTSAPLTAVSIPVEGDLVEVQIPSGDTDASLDAMQAGVGGYIEVVYTLPEDFVLVVNEEGLLKDLPVNLRASTLAGQPLVGDCLLLRAAPGAEEFTSATLRELAALLG